MTAEIGKFFVKDTATIRDDYLRTTKNALVIAGVPDPQVGPNSEPYIRASAIANEVTVLNSNAQIKCDAQMPDTATGSDPDGIADITRIGKIVGLVPRGASTSHGFIVYASSATGPVAVNLQLLDSGGLRYQVSVGGIYANGDQIPIASIDAGAKTNHVAGDTLRWVAAPPYAAPTADVATGGLTGGSDKEGAETFRVRVLDRFANPPSSGNWPQLAELAEDASNVVQRAFVYPALNGPATVHIAVIGYATSTSKNRDVDPAILSSEIVPTVQGQIPEWVESVITTVTNQPVDLSIGLTLPASPAAVPAGPGGGWVDGTPWPAVSGLGQNYTQITAVTSETVFTLNAPTAPQDGVSSVAYLSATDWKLYTAKVLTHSGTAGAYVVTIDTAWPNLVADLALGGTGPMVFPQAVNTQAYINAFLAFCALMGPGEKTSNTSVLTRGYRHPVPAQSWPSTFSAQALKAISNAGDEVLDEQWLSRSATTPTVPGSVLDPPSQLTPRQIGFYAL